MQSETIGALLLSPTASGKSLIIYLLSRWYEKENVLILVPTTSLVEQMYSDFIDYGYDDTKMQKIYQGHSKDITKPITISTWQSLYKLPRKFFENFGCILGDEVHLFKAKSLTGIMNKSISCKYRHGFTGTLDGTQTHRLILEGLFGSVNRVTTTKELMDKKTLAKLVIKCIVLQYPEIDCKFMKTQKFQDEVDLIVRDERRNKFIVNLTKHLKGNTLLLFQFVEKHGAILYDMMKDLKEKYFMFMVELMHKQGRIFVKLQRKKKAQSSLHHTVLFLLGLIFAIFITSCSQVQVNQALECYNQSVEDYEKDRKPNLRLWYDIADDLTYKSRQNFTLRHFMERINIYNEEEFDYEIKNLNIEK